MKSVLSVYFRRQSPMVLINIRSQLLSRLFVCELLCNYGRGFNCEKKVIIYIGFIIHNYHVITMLIKIF